MTIGERGFATFDLPLKHSAHTWHSSRAFHPIRIRVCKNPNLFLPQNPFESAFPVAIYAGKLTFVREPKQLTMKSLVFLAGLLLVFMLLLNRKPALSYPEFAAEVEVWRFDFVQGD